MLIGQNIGTVSNCYATGVVSGDYVVGGLVGINASAAIISDCHATGAVSGDDHVGGLVGENGGTVSNCYATGVVSGGDDVGGLVGYNDESDIFASFWDTQTTGQSDGVGYNYGSGTVEVYGRTTAQMKIQSTFIGAGWDFVGETENGTDETWIIIDGMTYPRFWWEGSIIFVDVNALGANNGTSWTDAYNHLQDALSDANSNPKIIGIIILVAEGTYKPDPNGLANPREATFQLINGVAIYGGFPSGGGSWQDCDPNMYETILSGDIGTEEEPNDNSYHVVTGSNTEPDAIIDGFTITGGNANGTWPNSSGGGMYNEDGNPTIRNCTFKTNVSENGGGMLNDDSDPYLIGCTFSDNKATGIGGGIWNHLSSPVLINSIFYGNSAYNGGGTYDDGGSAPEIVNCIFIGNSADSGGGMFINHGNPTVTNCTFSGNWAEDVGGEYTNLVPGGLR